MKNRTQLLIGVCLGVMAVFCVASVLQRNSGIFVTGDFGGEPIFSAEQNNQTAPWVNFTSIGVSKFQVPASGIIPTNFGGTGITAPATIPVWVVISGTNGLTYTNRIINGVLQ